MTVDQSALDHSSQSAAQKRSLLGQLEEVTGITDEAVLSSALDASRNKSGSYDITHAVNILVDGQAKLSKQSQAASGAVKSKSQVDARKWESPVVDLTSENSPDKDDLEKAIALSLQENKLRVRDTQIATEEDEEIHRAVEQSLAESKAGGKRKRGAPGEIWVNPQERQRQSDNWPVGLQNVGNTCWFNAVLQSLFHLPALRNLVFRFHIPKDEEVAEPTLSDVSEFTHKLLEWLEDAFELQPADQMDTDPQPLNPMTKLFYGSCKSEGSNDGRRFSNTSKLGLFPLQVSGHKDIYQSLEAWASSDIEGTEGGQEHWFTSLPPVLLFELSRFDFNKETNRPEKIHNRLDFPNVIFMDRFLEENRNIIKIKREEIRKLGEERERYKEQLEKYLNFGERGYPLQDVLQYSLEFAESGRPLGESGSRCTSSSSVQRCHSSSIRIELGSGQSVQHVPSSPCGPPQPRQVTESELITLRNCLGRWRREVEREVRELQELVATLDVRINKMYEQESLQKVPYSLHAVLVHEGQAVSGHYWAYVWVNGWLKFNDITVTESSWDELQKESFGGYQNTCAYCLMYINQDKMRETETWINGENYTKDTLPGDLLTYLRKDNEQFMKELELWEKKEKEQKQEPVHKLGDLATSYAKIALPEMMEVIRASQLHVGPSVTTDLFHEVYGREMKRIKELSTGYASWDRYVNGSTSHSSTSTDPRLLNIAVYLLLNDLEFPYIQWVVLHQFTIPQLASDPTGRRIQPFFENKLKFFQMERTSNEFIILEEWQKKYRNFRNAAYYFTYGMEKYYEKRYSEALVSVCQACHINNNLKQDRHGSLQEHILFECRRHCLISLSDKAISYFRSNSMVEVTYARKWLTELIIPCMATLSPSSADQDAEERIRKQWCSLLGCQLDEDRSKMLGELLPLLIEPQGDVVLMKPEIREMSQLSQRYARVIHALYQPQQDADVI